tara:strand:+ start:33648 stop:34313 length:666 start_codon:yes stop_codon:yes gene_type:complete
MTLLWLKLIIKRDLLIAFRRSATFLMPFIFFLIVITFFPISLSPERTFLLNIAPGIIWVATLLSSLLAIESIFNEDYMDGTLDHFFIDTEPSFMLIFAKVFCHWMVTGGPILIAALLASIFLFLPLNIFVALLVSLTLGTIFLSLLGALGSALSLGKGAILTAVIVLPFSIPTLLFGTNVLNLALDGQPYSGYLLLMGAMVSIGIPVLCLLTSEAIKLYYE